jgi:uncharacterized membrane protein
MNLSISKSSKSLLLLYSISLLLICVRVYFDNSLTWFYFLLKNLILGTLPLIFIVVARNIYESKTIKFLKVLSVTSFIVLWLLFLPNSPYMITDLIHLDHLPNNLLWYDATTIFVNALTALGMGFYSTYIFQKLSNNLLSKNTTWVLVILSQILSAFGVYLGRFLRFNSWDLFFSPKSLVQAINYVSNDKLAFKMTLVFSLVLIALYLSFYYMLQPEKQAAFGKRK